MSYQYNLCKDCARRNNGCPIDPIEPVEHCIEYRWNERLPTRGVNPMEDAAETLNWMVWKKRYLFAYTQAQCALKALKDGRITHAMNFLKDI